MYVRCSIVKYIYIMIQILQLLLIIIIKSNKEVK